MQPTRLFHTTLSSRIDACFSIAALVGAFSVTAAPLASAAFMNLVENGNVSLSGTSTVGEPTGTVIAAQDNLFNVSPDLKGVLRSFVVDTGSGYDFYYQVWNTGTTPAPDSDIFRMTITGGFSGATTSVTYRTDLTNLDFSTFNFSNGPAGGAGSYVTGTINQTDADRGLAGPGAIGFDFDFIPGDPGNLHAGETSTFAVVRTNATTLASVNMQISGTGTANAPTYAPVPEPGVAALLSIGVLQLARRRKVRF